MAEQVAAHQVQSEAPTVVMRTKADYAAHVRWRQDGWLNRPGRARKPLVEIASAVYQVQGGKIVRYDIQIDRRGQECQLIDEASD